MYTISKCTNDEHSCKSCIWCVDELMCFGDSTKYLCGYSTSNLGASYRDIAYECDNYEYGRRPSLCESCKDTSCIGWSEAIVTYCTNHVDTNEPEKDNISIPSRYNIDGYDPYFVMRLWSKFDPDMSHMESIFRGNALKYLWRYRHKNGKEDLEKCIDELNKLRDEYLKQEV